MLKHDIFERTSRWSRFAGVLEGEGEEKVKRCEEEVREEGRKKGKGGEMGRLEKREAGKEGTSENYLKSMLL